MIRCHGSFNFSFESTFAVRLDLYNESDDKAYIILNLFNSEYNTSALEDRADRALTVHHVASRMVYQAGQRYPVRVAKRTIQTTAKAARNTAGYVAKKPLEIGHSAATKAYYAQYATRVHASTQLNVLANKVGPKPTN